MVKFIDRLLLALLAWACPGIIYALPPGVTIDNSAMLGIFQAFQLLNVYSYTPVAVTISTQTPTLTAAQMVQGGVLLCSGSPGGAVTATTDTAINLIAAMGSGSAGPPLNGTFFDPVRIFNNTGQTITLTAGTGVTISGTATVSNGNWREWMICPTAAGAVTITNIGGGTI